jgi:endoglucanase
VAAVTYCLDQLARRTHEWDVVAVATVQEEVGLHGAMTAAHRVAPDLAIAIDTTFGAQRGTGDDESFELGDGPTIGVGPNFHPRLVKALRAVADELELDVQIEGVHGDSGTDAWAIQVSREGVPTVLLSIPIRNMHTPLEVVDLRDVTLTGRLMAEFIARLDAAFLDSIAWGELKPSSAPAKGNPA